MYSAGDAASYATPNDEREFGDRSWSSWTTRPAARPWGGSGSSACMTSWPESPEPRLLAAYARALAGVPRRRLRIFMIDRRGAATYGGIERHVEGTGARLRAARGHEVTVYCRPHYTGRAARIAACGSCAGLA